MKLFIIFILLVICLTLTYFIFNGTFCTCEYIKPMQNTNLIPSFLGVLL